MIDIDNLKINKKYLYLIINIILITLNGKNLI